MSIEVKNISKLYGTQKALDKVTFNIGTGEIVGFLGPNGAGKSTMMKIITGYLPASSGDVLINGMDINAHPVDIKKKIGYLPENNPLYPDMYVMEYLKYIAGIYKLGKATGHRIKEIIDLTGIGPEQHKKIGELSKGYRQRVGLAQALIHDPEVLILGEEVLVGLGLFTDVVASEGEDRLLGHAPSVVRVDPQDRAGDR